MKKQKVLVLLAHPTLFTSVINRTMATAIGGLENVLVHNLYESYPDFYIDVEHEKRLLLEADLVVFQSPFYWYSVTPMLKMWEDEVLEQGFAYGAGGDALHGKDFMLALSTGGREEAYDREGYNYFYIDELLTPFVATASLCGMNYRPPLLIHGSYSRERAQVEEHARRYKQLLQGYVQEGASVFENPVEET